MRPNHHDDDRETAQQHPEEVVDALEERVVGSTDSAADNEEEGPAPAIEQNLDSDELGSADAGTEPPD
jgi:hypothetical protein